MIRDPSDAETEAANRIVLAAIAACLEIIERAKAEVPEVWGEQGARHDVVTDAILDSLVAEFYDTGDYRRDATPIERLLYLSVEAFGELGDLMKDPVLQHWYRSDRMAKGDMVSRFGDDDDEQ
jgi:hypothetical protein